MDSIILNAPQQGEISVEQYQAALEKMLEGRNLKKVLLLPPDLTRMHSRAGEITAWLYDSLKGSCQVDVMPALGSHTAMTAEELRAMFGEGIPPEAFLVHDWRNELLTVGTVPGSFVSKISCGRLDYDIEVQVNKRLYDGYDLIVSIGQVVPHEVAGMANHWKNIFVGVGGIGMIHRTHFLGAVCGMEQALGNDHAPVRQVFDYAARFVVDLPIVFAFTVIKPEDGRDAIKGFYLGDRRDAFEAAVDRSRQDNINWLEKPLKTCVCWMEPEEFRSFWLSNKSVYRTRMAMADGGKLIVLAPAVEKFGEDRGMDALLRKYGYKGTDFVLKCVEENEDLGSNLSAAAHLIHGSSEGRFDIYYAAPKLCREEIESAGFLYLDYDDAMKRYSGLKDGYNTVDGEEVYFISNPAMGLWRSRE